MRTVTKLHSNFKHDCFVKEPKVIWLKEFHEDSFKKFVDDFEIALQYDILELDSNMPEEDYKRLSTIQNELEKTLKSIPMEIYKDMFGDHCEITATVDGFDVEEYDHE